MLDPLPIQPFTRPVRGEATLPGSKSITNRALVLAALCDGPVTLTNALISEDTEIMVKALNALGLKVTVDTATKTMQVGGQGGKIPAESAELFVGNAGTAARFLTALCAAAPRGVFKIDGVPQMRKRPMKGLIDALRAQGANITCTGKEGFFPLTLEAHGLKGGDVTVDAKESSQIFSALLMAAPLAKKDLTIHPIESDSELRFVAMTIDLMQQFSHTASAYGGNSRTVTVTKTKTPYQFLSTDYRVESDATAASYFIALPIVVGGRISIPDYRPVLHPGFQGDVMFSLKLQVHGLISGVETGGSAQRIQAGPKRAGITQNFRDFSDTFLTLAAIAPLLEGPTTITGIAHTRKQETDRVTGAYNELKKLGQEVEQGEDWLKITPRPLKPGVEIETYRDHRFAMSFAILGCHNLMGDDTSWLKIRNPDCCAKTFPDFFTVLEQVREQSHRDH
ncbi:MAG: 3-phosphoshikimate 1-carboxyvinyltransferase [Verrucomicrobia bacterium RIFCSPLOWO2_12_FULL_64_8]|nr:MAG: 3-phosphoshikimate 1-carboxyvinyltransferase [Verrucomicrobia bacterium RIFCSPLOWO2_12_FULL_64_8]